MSSIELTDSFENLKIFSYKTCSNDSSIELKKTRGIVKNGETIVAPSLGYTDEYNELDVPDLNISDHIFFQSEEGTFLRLFYFEGGVEVGNEGGVEEDDSMQVEEEEKKMDINVTKTNWHLVTHRKLDAFKSRWGGQDSFGNIFINCLKFLNTTFDDFTNTLDKTYIYMFLIRNTKHNRVVSHAPENPIMYHICTMLPNQLIDIFTPIGIPKQTPLLFENMDQIKQYVALSDPFKIQGVFGFSRDGNQIKIVSQKYKKFMNIRNNEPNLSLRYLQLWKNNDQENLSIFFEIYPEYKNMHIKYNTLSFKIAKHLHNLYFKKFVKKEKIICKKEEWNIIRGVHEWFWAERTTRKVTFNVMLSMMLQDVNLRSLNKIITQKEQ